MFMLIYTFVVNNIFKITIPNFSLHVFIGTTTWKLISGSILMSPTVISRNKTIFQQVYFHKFVYPTVYLLVAVYEFLIANILILFLMYFSNIRFTWHLIEFPIVTLISILFTWGCSLIISHLGIYFFDLRNILDFSMRFLFYLSPVMWSYENRNFEFMNYLKISPISIIMESFRNITFRGTSPNYLSLLFVLTLSMILISIGYYLISKYEDEYARVF